MKTYVVGTHLKHLSEMLLTNTHNICLNKQENYLSFLVEKCALSGALRYNTPHSLKAPLFPPPPPR